MVSLSNHERISLPHYRDVVDGAMTGENGHALTLTLPLRGGELWSAF